MCVAQHRVILLRALEDEGEREVVAMLAREVQKTTRKAWTREANVSINAAVRALGGAGTLREGLLNMNRILLDGLSAVFTKREIRRISASMEGMYIGFKKVSADQQNVKLQFRLVDRNAVKALSREQPFWIGDFYSTHMSDRIRDISRKAIVQKGLGRKEAAKVMSRVLRKELSWAGGPAKLRGIDVIPARFAGNVGGYSEILVANAANRGRNMAFLSSFRDAGIERFRWNSVMDERTSEVCAFLDGREFAVETGMALMDEVSAAETPVDVKEITPWQTEMSVKAAAGKGTTSAQNARLAAAGVMVPPAHGRCRSVVEAV
jgi:ribosomal protein L22